ncbi:MAG: metal-dependent hydrolase [Candidatus Bathyarchaeales archaeon]
MAKVTWFGHSAFKIEVAGKTVLIDPWLDGNPSSPIKASEIAKADVVYVTHDHDDHLGDAVEICKRTKAVFVATFELGNYAQENGVSDVVGLNIGGSAEVGGVKLTVVHATHTASKGAPTGVIVEGEGKRIYHMGDTGLFSDLSLFGELYKPDLAMVPIGGFYTMGAREAAEAVSLLKPKVAVPMHYGTFPVLAQSADEFVKFVREKTPRVKVVVLKAGESYTL